MNCIITNTKINSNDKLEIKYNNKTELDKSLIYSYDHILRKRISNKCNNLMDKKIDSNYDKTEEYKVNEDISMGIENRYKKANNKNDIKSNRMLETEKVKRMRFSSEDVQVLKNWLKKNKHNPYLTNHDLQKLIKKTKMTPKQINTWITNARRRILPKLLKNKSRR